MPYAIVMQQFVVPQFIDIEDKVIGPITTRQFIIIIVALIIMFIEYKMSDFALFLVLAVFTFAFLGLFAFLKVNGRPVYYFLLNVLQTMKRYQLRVWIPEGEEMEHVIRKKKKDEDMPKVFRKEMVSSSRLSQLSLVVDTGGVYRGEEKTTLPPSAAVKIA